MMNFKMWLESSEYTSWLDPNGNFHPITRETPDTHWNSHSTWALQHGYHIEEMWESGWMRITFIGDILYISNDLKQLPNYRQKQAVIDLAITSHRFNQVVYDNGETERTIWSKDDDVRNETRLAISRLTENQVIEIPFANLIISRNSLFRAMQDVEKGRTSKTVNSPIEVWGLEGNQNYQLTDGYHRVFVYLIFGSKSVQAEIIGRGYSDYWTIATLHDRFQYNPTLKFQGLENLADEEILEDLKNKLRPLS